MVDDFCQSQKDIESCHPGPQAALSRSEVVTLALFGPWVQFKSERAFDRDADRNWRAAFPTWPDRSQFHRWQRHQTQTSSAFGLFLVQIMKAQECLYERLASSGIPTRDARATRRWLVGGSGRYWLEQSHWLVVISFHLLVSIAKEGVITGFGFGPASTHDQRLIETFLAARAHPIERLTSVGARAQGVYLADQGFAGAKPHASWRALFGAAVITPPHQSSKRLWSKQWRRWLASLRQLGETISDKLLNTFRLARERPHTLDGFQARLGAKVSLHNFCIWLNGSLQRAPLTFADLIDW